MNIGYHLHKNNYLSKEQLEAIDHHEKTKLFSLHWELRTVMYLGVSLLAGGLGIFVYKNIDTIGHQAILAFIALVFSACFYYCYKHRQPYSHSEVKYETPFFDYALLLGSLLVVTFLGYLQYQYEVFGTHYGLATLIPTIIYLFTAYRFDHRGVLSLGIVGLASWAGLSLTPMELLSSNDFSSDILIYTGLLLGAVLGLVAFISNQSEIKKHFSFSYNNFGSHLFFVATLSALFQFHFKLVSFLLLAAAVAYYIYLALAQKSFYFLLISVVYGYIGITYMMFEFILRGGGEALITLVPMYFLFSCGGIIYFLIKYKSILKIKE